jgi:hypothetical protein
MAQRGTPARSQPPYRARSLAPRSCIWSVPSADCSAECAAQKPSSAGQLRSHGRALVQPWAVKSFRRRLRGIFQQRLSI